MVFIKNSLPIKQGGSIFHGNTEIYFTKDSNLFGTYIYRTITTNKLDKPAFLNFPQITITTINDSGVFSVPITVNFLKYDEISFFIFYYYDPQEKQFTFCAVNPLSSIAVNIEKDVFFAYEKEVFYIPYNYSKVIYHVTLINNTSSPLSWTAISTCFNTNDGLSDGYTVKESQVFPIGQNSSDFFFFGGICEDQTSYSSCLRIYRWDTSSKQLLFTRTSTSDYNKTYHDTGFFYPVSKTKIIGLNCNYSGLASSTGYNRIFSINSSSSLVSTRFDFYNSEQSTIMYSATKNHNGGYFWRGKPKVVSYTYSDSHNYTCYTLDGYTYKQTEDVNYINPAVMFGVSDTQFLSIPKGNSELITTLDLSTITDTTISKSTLLTTNNTSCLVKIPGIPVIYYDPNVTDVSASASFYFSETAYFPVLLPPGSIVNGDTVTDDVTPYPTTSSNLMITTRGVPLKKTIYGIQNDKGINI